MAHYDQDTLDFFEKLAGDDKERPRLKSVAKQTLGVAKDLSGSKSQIETAIAKRVMRLATRASMGSLEKDAGISPISIYEMLNNHYGMDWHEWAPETIWQTLEHEQSVTPSPEIRNLIGALQVICKTDLPFEDFSTFEKINHALNYNPVLFGVMQPSEPDEVAFTAKVLKQIRHREDFDPEILAYIAACAKHAGLVYLPEDLFPAGSQEALDKLGNDLELKDKVANKKLDDVLDESVQLQFDKLEEIREYAEA